MKFRQAGRHVRRRAVQGRLPHLLHRPGNPGRPRQLSDAGHRPEQPPVPPAGPGLLEPRQPADERAACRTTRDAGRGVCGAVTALLHGAANLTSAELAEAVGPFDELRQEPRADAPRDADASRRGRGDQRRRARRICKDAARSMWDEVLAAGRRARLPQRAGHGARPHRHDQLHDGLRHHRHRAGHRPGEVQAARRRRHAEDRQPDRAARAAARSATTSRRSARSWPTSTSTTRSKARPTSRTSTSPCSTVRSSRATASAAIAWQAHVRMMAAAQPFLSGAISQDGQHAARRHARGHRQGVLRRLEARPQGPGHLSRRLEGKPAAQHEHRRRQGGRRRPQSRQAAPRTPARHAAVASPTSSTSPATKATSPSACSPTAGPASCSSRWPRKAARSAA